MSKYDGIKKVETTIQNAEDSSKPRPKKAIISGGRGILFRICTVVIIGCGLFLAKNINHDYAKTAVSTVKNAIMYDITGTKDNYGRIDFVEKLKKLFNNTNSADDEN